MRWVEKMTERGRTMFVLPFSVGPVESPKSRIGAQLTDSPYAVVSMRIVTRIGLPVLKEIDKDTKRVAPCMPSVGAPPAPDVPGHAIRRNMIEGADYVKEILVSTLAAIPALFPALKRLHSLPFCVIIHSSE